MTKLDVLKQNLKKMEKILLAYSGGVDSTFLLKVSCDVLGRENVLAVTKKSEIVSNIEFANAKRNASVFNARHIIFEDNVLEDKKISSNDIKRCFFCYLP